MGATNSETVLITGASSGIGLELAKCFAADGCRLILVARNSPALEKLAGELRRAHGIETRVMTADLARPETPERIFEELRAADIAVDVLVNNAGFGLQGAFVDLPHPRQLEIIHVNIGALTGLTGWFLPDMIKRNRGGILNVGSVAGFLPGPNMAVYYASKAYVNSFTEALAGELSGTGLTVSALCPGATETNFSAIARGQKVERSRTTKMTAEAVARYGHRAYRNGKVTAISGLPNRVLVFLIRFAPRAMVRKIMNSYNGTK
jgi:uncharacterized protein